MTEATANLENALAQTISDDDAFFNSVIADIDKTAEQEIISDDLDSDEDFEEADSKKSQEQKTNSDAPSHDKRKNQNRAQERIQQVITQKNLAESKHQAALERLNIANDRISLLESQIASYEPIIKEFNEFKASFIENGEMPDVSKSEVLKTDKPLTAAEIERLFEEREKKREQAILEKEKLAALSAENERIKNDWKPHIKKLEDPNCSTDKKNAFQSFCLKASENPSRRELIKVLGKYDNAIEIVYGLSKKQGFDSMSLAEQIELAFKLDSKINAHKQKVTESTPTGIDSKMKRDSNRPTSYAEYLARKRGAN